MKLLLNTATAALLVAGTSALAVDTHELYSQGNWSTNLHVFEDGSMACSASSSIDKPGEHYETLSLHSDGSGFAVVLFNSEVHYAEGTMFGVGLQVDDGPIVEYSFVSAGRGALFTQAGPHAYDELEAFMAGSRLRTVNMQSGDVVSEYNLSGSRANTLEMAQCVAHIPRAPSEHEVTTGALDYFWL